MQINTHVFQAAATIYESLVSHRDNKYPHDPSYAREAVEIAETLYKASKNDPVYTMAAARALCGFKLNTVSGHCTRDELINLALLGASHLVEAFAVSPQPQQKAQPAFAVPNNNHPPPQMPPLPYQQVVQQQAVMPPNAVPSPFEPIPSVPVEVPDFT